MGRGIKSFKGLAFILICFGFAYCQKQKIDNITEIVLSEKQQEQDSINRFLSNFAYQNPDSCLALIDTYQDQYGMDDSMFYYTTLLTKSTCYMLIGDVDANIGCLDIAGDFWSRRTIPGANEKYFLSQYNKGYAYNIKEESDSSIYYFKKAIRIAANEKLDRYQINGYLALTDIYKKREEYGNAIEVIEKCLHLCNENNDSTCLVASYLTCADLYTDLHFYEEARIQYIELNKYSSYFDDYASFSFNNNQGRMHYLQGNYREAISFDQKAYEYRNSIDQFSELLIVNNLAELYLAVENVDSAQIYLDILQNNRDFILSVPVFEFNYYSLLGDFYRKKNERKEAQKYFDKADSISRQHLLDKTLEKLHLQRKTNYYTSIRDYHQAYVALQVYNSHNQAILKETNRKQVSSLKYKYQRDTLLITQQHLIALQETEMDELKYQRQMIIVITVFILVLIIGIALWRRNNEFKKREIISLTHSRDVALLRMESTRNRIGPHFMFNVLNSIIKSDSTVEEMNDSLKSFIHLLQSNLVNIDSIGVPLCDELKFVKDFVMLDNLRFESKVDLNIKMDDTVKSDRLIPSMSIHILVENAIKHGLRPKKGDKNLLIDVSVENNKTIIKIEDNGVGRKSQRKTHGVGVGTKVLNQFISMANQKNMEKVELKYIDLKDDKNEALGTVAMLLIPNSIDLKLV